MGYEEAILGLGRQGEREGEKRRGEGLWNCDWTLREGMRVPGYGIEVEIWEGMRPGEGLGYKVESRGDKMTVEAALGSEGSSVKADMVWADAFVMLFLRQAGRKLLQRKTDMSESHRSIISLKS